MWALIDSPGEEEDGDEDEEAEAPTGKRVAEDDEVCVRFLSWGTKSFGGFWQMVKGS